ncbi:MAG: hypothetical protein M3025_02290, partial [Actinomycetota bacterium]|nr:hypothetical protein [Actinomycetota bacterium]
MVPDDRCELLCLDLPRAEEIRKGLDITAAGAAAGQAKALGDQTRLTIAMALREGEELCVCDLPTLPPPASSGLDPEERDRLIRRAKALSWLSLAWM